MTENVKMKLRKTVSENSTLTTWEILISILFLLSIVTLMVKWEGKGIGILEIPITRITNSDSSTDEQMVITSITFLLAKKWGRSVREQNSRVQKPTDGTTLARGGRSNSRDLWKPGLIEYDRKRIRDSGGNSSRLKINKKAVRN